VVSVRQHDGEFICQLRHQVSATDSLIVICASGAQRAESDALRAHHARIRRFAGAPAHLSPHDAGSEKGQTRFVT
jgi:hypothetical protein